MDRTNRNTALASALAEELARSGVEHACVAPGSRSAPLALALWHEPGIRVWSHVDERCAGFFALGIAQRSGRPAVVLTTSGTAGANVYPAVAEAGEARVPLIVITADRPPELRGRGAGQTIDQLKLFGSAVRWFCELGVQAGDDAGLLHFRSAAVRAAAEACGPPAGPVHLNVALREPLAPIAQAGVSATGLAAEGRPEGQPLTTVRLAPRAPSAEIVASVAEVIAASPRGLVVAGRQRDPALSQSAAALARAAGYPILAEPTSQLRAGEHDRDQVIAPYDAVLRDPPAHLRPELVLRFGDMVTSKAVRQWLAASPDCRQIVIDPDDAWNEPTTIASEIVRVEPTLLCDALAGTFAPRAGGEWLEAWLAAASAAERSIEDFMRSLGDELFEPRVHRELAQVLPPAATVYVASSMPVRELEAFFPSVETPLDFVANRGANGIDGLVSSALGAAAVAPGRTFVLVGDLGLYHDMNGLLAARRLGVEATIIVLDNGGGAIFDFLPIAGFRDGYEELFATPTGIDLANVADLYELPFARVSSYAELREAIARPGLVAVPLDRARNVVLHRELFARISKAVRAASKGERASAEA